MSKFPVNSSINIEIDFRRLEFIASWFEEIIFAECKYIKESLNQNSNQTSEKLSYFKDSFDNNQKSNQENTNFKLPPNMNKNFLKDMLEFRKKNSEMCNMILVLLVVSFHIFFKH